MTDATLPGAVVDALVCPVCRQRLRRSGSSLRCLAGHTFDIARQGYVNLLAGNARTGTADTAAMVADRAAFLSGGHYAPLAELVAEWAAGWAPGLVVDAGAGVGYYLGAVLDRRPDSVGLALDLSPLALRRAARAHDRIGAAVWDVWQPWPVRDHAAAVLVNVFAPRNGAEFHRVLRPDGTLVVVTPTAAHLAELGAGMLNVDPRKDERLAATLAGFEPVARQRLEYPLALSAEDVRRVVGMGPAAFHDRPPPETGSRQVTASFQVTAYRA
ncbi:MAG TPA: rRNA (guanine-N1)-methyltransferase [Pseudonocardiaceae bacterium]|nr:rRNA (guanine-N1)-methyltransferase [Pseudonocardiaceae bacterium]